MEFTKSTIDKQKEFLENAYNRAMAYTNLIMIGGYAGFFALWGLTKEYLSKGQVFWSALLILISIVFFMSFEIYKMIHNGIVFQSLQKVIKDPEQFHTQIEIHNKKTTELAVRLGRIWIPVLIVAIGTGLGAYGVLGYAFVCELFNLYR